MGSKRLIEWARTTPASVSFGPRFPAALGTHPWTLTHPGFPSLAAALELSGARLTNAQTDENDRYRWHQSDPRRAAGSNRTLYSPIPKARFETVLNMSPCICNRSAGGHP